MGDVASALFTVVVGIAVFAAALLLLYGLTNVLPKRYQEGPRIAVFLGPALLLLIIGLIVPAIRTIILSFKTGDQADDKVIGFQNYWRIFTTKAQQDSLINTFLWVVVGTMISTIVGIAIARFADRMRGENVAKAAIFLPTAVSLAGAGVIWKFVYAGPPQKIGLLNAVTKAIPGMPESFGGNGDTLWLNESWPRNTFLLIVILIWVQAGFATVVFSAAIKGVPDSLIEAAKVDGATERQAFFKVTLPYIRATIVTVMTTTVIAALKVFDIVKATTGGNFRTSTIANDVYDKYFREDQVGYGSALAVLLFILVVPVVIVNQRTQRRAREM
jgi:alpha-glucoside transport system permease protein